jgi:dissimilatory sulfite reductase (desulfoviridin) alpha/beta subunit
MTSAFKLRNGTVVLSTEAPGGVYNSHQLKSIAVISEAEAAIVKATEDHRLAICVKPESIAKVSEHLRAAGLGVRDYQSGIHLPVSCVGQLCPDSDQDALGSALDITEALANKTSKNPIKIGVNGCAKCCVPCHTLDVSIVGESNGYRVSLGGKASQLPELASFIAEGIPSEKLPGLMTSVIDLYNAEANDGESLHSVIDRVGATDFIKAFAPYSQDAATNHDPFAGDTTETSVESSIESSMEPLEELATESESTETIHSSSEVDEYDIDPAVMSSSDDINPQTSAANQTMSSEIEIIDSPESAQDIELPSASSEEILDFETDMNSEDNQEPEVAAVKEEQSITPMNLNAEINAEGITEENLTEQLSLETINTESEESLYEQKLTESIAAEQELIVDDSEDTSREEALEFLDDTKSNINDLPSDLGEEKIPEELFGDSINPNDDLESDFALLESPDQPNETAEEYSLPLSEIVSTKRTTKIANNDEAAGAAHQSDANKWVFSSINVDEEGNPVIGFKNGIHVKVTYESIAAGPITVGGHTVSMEEVARGLEVHIDGIAIFLPFAA